MISTEGRPVLGGGFPGEANGGGAGPLAVTPVFDQQRLLEKNDKKNGPKTPSVGSIAFILTEVANNLNFFLLGEYGSIDRDITRLADGYNSDVGRIATGVDYSVLTFN